MKFCSNCGHQVVLKLVEGEDKERHYCEDCQTIHYQNPKIIVGCIPRWEDKILLCKRNIEPRKGFWTVPAGFMENGETAEDGAAREAYEEAYANLDIKQLLCIYNVAKINQVHLFFLADLKDTNYKAGIESQEVALFKEEEIPWKDLAFTSTAFTLKHFFRDRKNGRFEIHSGAFDWDKWMTKHGDKYKGK